MTNYSDSFGRCSMTFQYIEEYLKQILLRLDFLKHICTVKYIHYDCNSNDKSIENSAMGRLIEMFKKYCDDKDLITDLRKIKDHRNHIAHKGFVASFKNLQDEEKMLAEIQNLERINIFATKSYHKLRKFCEDLDVTLNKAVKENPPKHMLKNNP